MNHNLVIEIGTEELPSSYMIKMEQDLTDAFNLFLSSHFLQYKNTKVFVTPRRMVFWVEEIASKQDMPEKKVKGPPLKAAFKEDGSKTSALIGFLEKCQSTDYYIEGSYVFATIKGQNEETSSIFQNEFSFWLASFPFEKKMRWESWQFVRPVRWIVAFFGNHPIPLILCGITTGTITRLLRGFEPILINSADDYFQKIVESGIVLSSKDRKRIIEQSIPGLVSEDIVLENVCRTEEPIVSEATFSESLLILPEKVICTVISNQLKCFPAWENGKLLPKFFFVMNGKRDITLVRKGYEKVITARLNDASYFFHRDLAVPLRDRTPDLKKMTFIEKLGTLADKTQRLTDLSKNETFFTNREDLEELISLSKVDLATTMVQELTELQGTIGKIYALKQGIKDVIAEGIEDHYHPRSEGDSLPVTELGIMLSILDRTDTITGAHAIGMTISSSSDPLGLRRIANGLIRILSSSYYPINMQKMFAGSLATYQEVNQFSFDFSLIMENLLVFFLTRLRSFLSIYYRYDVVSAVAKEEWANPYILDNRCKVILSELDNPSFKILSDSYTRIKNITKGVDPGLQTLDDSLFQKEEETILLEAILKCPDLQETDTSRDVLRKLYELNSPIINFFDNILVMDEDMKIRKNRLQLLCVIYKKLNQFADFSKIVFEGGDKS